MPPAARVSDSTGHGIPLSPGPGSTDVLIGNMPAWRAVPSGVGAAAEGLADTTKQLLDSATLNPGSATSNVTQMITGMTETAAKAASEGAAAAIGAAASQATTVGASLTSLSTAWTSASAAPGGQPAADQAFTQGMKATVGAAATAVFSAIVGQADQHVCSIPVPPMPHGPGVVTKGSSTVVINGLPAVRQGDQVIEACGGPDPIAAGCPTVIIGG